MAELNIGKHCSLTSCNRLDFLPCPCNGCGLDFCKDHMSYESHCCCRKDLNGPVSQERGSAALSSYACTLKDCNKRELVSIPCEACGANFCLLHRHQADHLCKMLTQAPERMSQTAEQVRQILSKAECLEKKKAAPTSQKSKALNAKIALMKLKQKAVGDKDIPDVDKVFFKVVLPLDSNTRTAQVYLNKTWSVGRSVDKLAALMKIRNENNIANAKGLFLFDGMHGQILANEQQLSNVLKDDSDIYNGCTLILEYVDRSSTQLPSLEQYAEDL